MPSSPASRVTARCCRTRPSAPSSTPRWGTASGPAIAWGAWGLVAEVERNYWLPTELSHALVPGALNIGVGAEWLAFDGRVRLSATAGPSILWYDATFDSKGTHRPLRRSAPGGAALAPEPVRRRGVRSALARDRGAGAGIARHPAARVPDAARRRASSLSHTPDGRGEGCLGWVDDRAASGRGSVCPSPQNSGRTLPNSAAKLVPKPVANVQIGEAKATLLVPTLPPWKK